MQRLRFALAALCIPAVLSVAAPATQPAKPTSKPASKPAVAKTFPPKGDPIPAADRAELEAGVERLGREINAIGKLPTPAGSLDRRTLLADVQVYHNAVRYPLVYEDLLDVKKARAALAAGLERAAQLRAGKPEWIDKDGPRGYVSKIDASVQPYYLLMPTKAVAKKGQDPLRLDLFCHGRDEKLTELNFISAKVGNAPAAGADKLVALLYGRYCNANKFAGEVDCFEVIGDLSKRYAVDESRIVLTGFSMGGASTWHLAAHYPDRWVATSPGAGFADTAIFTGLAKNAEAMAAVPWWQRKLWRWYDAPDWAANFANVPTIAYAGELDKQILASETMEKALAGEGLKLERIVGPKTEHKYEPESLKEINRRLDAYAAKGREAMPRRFRFTTYTLRYSKMAWVAVEGLERHWERADVDAELTEGGAILKTRNVSALALTLPWKEHQNLQIDGVKVNPVWIEGLGGSSTLLASKENGQWSIGRPAETSPRKRPGLQGPIDDAFLDRFVIVKPTGKPLHEKSGAWAAAECDRAIDQWRKIFRGEAQVRPDDKVSADDIEQANLVLFGDPSSNQVLARMADKLPVKWANGKVTFRDKSYPADQHVPVMIFPNPLNPKRYVVLNSGFTFREADHSSNAKQIARLPDYAMIDITQPPGPLSPGKIVRAGFFGEKWELLPNDGQ